MRSLWRGSISFGLVNIPVRLYAAVEDRDLKFRFLHKKCHTPLIYEKKCPTCGTAVPQEEVERGYEYEKGRFVIIEDELLAAPGEHLHSINIRDFVNLADIEPVYYARPYYLAPGEGGVKAYRLLLKAMETTHRVAVATARLRSKESLVALRVYQNALLMLTMHYHDEIRSLGEIPELQQTTELEEKEVKMAVDLIENLAGEFHPERYQDTYRNHLRQVINDKIAGKEVTVPPTVPAPRLLDLMEALQASLEATQRKPGGKGGRGKRKKAVGS